MERGMEYMNQFLIPLERIESKIFLFREVKVMIAQDLALLYGVDTRTLNQAVSRNEKRFPLDFYVSAYAERGSDLEITNCDLQLEKRYSLCILSFLSPLPTC